VRTIVFIDGQNLYHLARAAWSPGPQVAGSPYGYPSYDVEKLAAWLVARDRRRVLQQIRFYTGVPEPRDPQTTFWHGFWGRKLRYLVSRGVYVYRGRVRPGGQEKGVDVSLAIDLIQLTYEAACDVAIIVSQDWDFGEAVRLARAIARDHNRALTVESAFPYTAGRMNPRGVPGSTWVHIDKATYDGCLDTRDYRR
jgi:uncharacterized LabA/DUF88 family protein